VVFEVRAATVGRHTGSGGVLRHVERALAAWAAEPRLPGCKCRPQLGAQCGEVGLGQRVEHGLGQDPDITDIQVERQIRASDGSWRQPDVSAAIDGQLVAFDIQLADAPLVTIQERGAFYRTNGIRHVWLTSAADLSRLSQLAFRDLHLNAGGRIFAIDTDVVAACVQSATFQLKELSIVPRLVPERPVHNIWDVAMVGRAVILMDPHQRKLEGEKRYQEALRVQVTPHFGPERTIIRQAAAQRRSLGWVAPQWDAIASQTKARNADTAKFDGVSEVLAWLHAVEVYVKSREPALRATALEALHAATERLLAVRNARDWAPLVVTTGQLLPSVEAALSAENRARLTALLTATEPVVGVVRSYANMLAILYPWLAFRLIVKAPKFGPPASRRGRNH
jgi:hypothetical protein